MMNQTGEKETKRLKETDEESESALDVGDMCHTFAAEQSRFPLNNTHNNKFHRVSILQKMTK